jgi:3-keto-5-aminohexanoate cleavage enzyme
MPEGVESESGGWSGSRDRGSALQPLIITCAITGDHQKDQHPNLPVTLEEQAEAAAEIAAAGASIVHIHGCRADDPTLAADDADRYRAINAAIRAKAPGLLVDNTQRALPLGDFPALHGAAFAYSTTAGPADPDIVSLNPGPMTFRGSDGAPSRVYITTFDDTARIAAQLREEGIKPQVFLYHPGHLDLLDYLIQRDLLAKPYFVQLVFGQQGGIAATPDAFLSMIRNLPPDTLFQTCALGLQAIDMNLMAILFGGHVRTGMEDSLFIRPGEEATGNAAFVERIVRIAREIGRPIATPEQARHLLGLG